MGRAFHGLEHFRAGVLERDIQVRQDLAFGHQRDDVVHVGVRVDIVQAHPHAHVAEGFTQGLHLGFQGPALPETGAVFDIHAVGGGVLGDHQQFLYAGIHQALGFVHDITDGPAHQLAAHVRDDAEGAAVVAAFGNLQVGVVARGQFDALGWYQVDKRVVVFIRGHKLVHRAYYFFIGLGAGNRQHAGVGFADFVCFHAHAAGYDHLAVLADGLADGVQGFLLGGVNKAAGVYHHDIGIVVGGHHVVPVQAQLGKNALGINQCLRAAQADKPYFSALGGVFCFLGHNGSAGIPGRCP